MRPLTFNVGLLTLKVRANGCVQHFIEKMVENFKLEPKDNRKNIIEKREGNEIYIL